jgi:methylated-DNA-protein-cysteine methyltransferase-like protein
METERTLKTQDQLPVEQEQPVVARPLYERIYDVVRQVPYGKVATYGQIAQIVGGCSARMVGYAMAALHGEKDVPWQRVINRMGKISIHGDFGNHMQKAILEEEGVVFNADGRTDLDKFGWVGPDSLPS